MGLGINTSYADRLGNVSSGGLDSSIASSNAHIKQLEYQKSSKPLTPDQIADIDRQIAEENQNIKDLNAEKSKRTANSDPAKIKQDELTSPKDVGLSQTVDTENLEPDPTSDQYIDNAFFGDNKDGQNQIYGTSMSKDNIYDQMGDINEFSDDSIKYSEKSTRSLFNRHSLFRYPNCLEANDFFDIAANGGSKAFPKFSVPNGNSVKFDVDGEKGEDTTGTGGRYPTIESLLTDFNEKDKPRTPYNAIDFMYGKWYNLIPLNRIITLRRFPFPVGHNLEKFSVDDKDKTSKDSQGKDYMIEGIKTSMPIAQAVTYYGDGTGNALSEFTKIAGYINWKMIEADVWDVDGGTAERGIEDTPGTNGLGSTGKGALKIIGQLANPDKQDIGGYKDDAVKAAKYNTFDYTHKVLGPVNVVHKTNVRDRGVGATMEFNLVFEYQIKSYNNVNPRIAMIDLVCNLMALSFYNAQFWGGANRYFPGYKQFGMMGNEKLFYSGDYGAYAKSFISDFSSGLGKLADGFMSVINGLLGGDTSSLQGAVKAIGTNFMDMQRYKSRPPILGFHSLLSGSPIGEWHMTVGNPYRPTLTIGNLICKGFDLQFIDEQLTADDFPSGIKYTIKLETGRPMDKGDLESIMAFGQGRLYNPPKGLLDKDRQKGKTDNINDPKHNKAMLDGTYKLTQNSIKGRADIPEDYEIKMMGTAY